MNITVIAEYQKNPAEGINVVSRDLIDELRTSGYIVRIIKPKYILIYLFRLIFFPAKFTIFTHGPGIRTVFATWLLRNFGRTRLIWIATRPDISRVSKWLTGRKTAHHIVCNRIRKDLTAVAIDAKVIIQPIGINPRRINEESDNKLWKNLKKSGVPLAVHVGHLRQNRGLENLIAVKELLGEQIEIVVQASPYFDTDKEVESSLVQAGIHVSKIFIPMIGSVYRSCDIYLFPVPPSTEGAIELPLSVLEALACKTPVISTPFGALTQTLRDTKGISFAEPANFAQAVSSCLNVAIPVKPEGLPFQCNSERLFERLLELIADKPCKN